MRILILRTSALGDIVHALPALVSLRRNLPAARIGWVVERSMAPLLEGHPDLDDLLTVRLREWRHRPFQWRTLREIFDFLKALDRFSADVILDLMGNHKSGILGALALADRRIGLARTYRREPSSAVWISEGVEPSGPHAVDRALSVLKGLGLPGSEPEFGSDKLFAHTPEAAAQLLAGQSGPFAVLLPGAGWENKRYPPQRWGEVARLLRETGNLDVWVTAGPGEEAMAQEVVESSNGAARYMGIPTLPELAAYLRAAEVVLGGDTGPVHLADALGTQTVCVMGPTDPERHAPYGSRNNAVWHELDCSFCYRRLQEIKGCLSTIDPGIIADRALAVMRDPS